MSKWIIVPVEVQRRELDAKLIVASLGTQRGYRTIIGRDQMVRRMAAYLPKGIMFDKSIEGERDTRISRFQKLGYAVTAMDEEATGFLMGPEAFMDGRLARKTLARTSRWFCINEEVRSHCVKRFPEHEDVFVTTGLGRTDTWRRQFQPLFAKEAEVISQRVGRFILFNSNFSTVNHGRGEAFVRRQMNRSRKGGEKAAQQRGQLIRENTANLEAYVAMLPKLLAWFPDHKVVIRPHPGENIEYWSERFGDIPRVEISGGGVVTPWIMASECMIHHGCTTGVEAELMDQPQINYAPHPDEHHDGEIPRAFSHFVHTEDELHDAVAKLINGSEEFRKDRDGLDRWFAALQGPLVAERVLAEFDKIAFDGRELSGWLPYARLLPRNLVARFKNLTARSKQYSAQKFEGTSAAELQDKLDIIAEVTHQEKPARARQIFEDLFLIEAE